MHSLPPFRADHVGSLLRTPEVLKARDDYRRGQITAQARRDVEMRPSALSSGCRKMSAYRVSLMASAPEGCGTWTSSIRLAGSPSPGQPEGPVPQRKGRHRVHAGGDAGDGELRLDCIFAEDLRSFSRSREGRQKHDPLTEHGALPLRARRDRSGGLPRPRRVLARSGAGGTTLTRSRRWVQVHSICNSTTPALPISNDPVAASLCHRDRRRRRASTRHLHPAHQRGALKKPAGMRVCTHMCRKLQVVVGDGQLRARRRSALQPVERRCSSSI